MIGMDTFETEKKWVQIRYPFLLWRIFMGEKVYFDSGEIKVISGRLVVNGETYLFRNISSVKVVEGFPKLDFQKLTKTTFEKYSLGMWFLLVLFFFGMGNFLYYIYDWWWLEYMGHCESVVGIGNCVPFTALWNTSKNYFFSYNSDYKMLGFLGFCSGGVIWGLWLRELLEYLKTSKFGQKYHLVLNTPVTSLGLAEFLSRTISGSIYSSFNLVEITNVVEQVNQALLDFDSMEKETVPVAQNNMLEEIRKLKVMLDEGLISEDDYEAKKKQLLGL